MATRVAERRRKSGPTVGFLAATSLCAAAASVRREQRVGSRLERARRLMMSGLSRSRRCRGAGISNESLSPFSAQLAGKMSPRPVNRSFAGAPFSGENSASARSTKSARATRCAAPRPRSRRCRGAGIATSRSHRFRLSSPGKCRPGPSIDRSPALHFPVKTPRRLVQRNRRRATRSRRRSRRFEAGSSRLPRSGGLPFECLIERGVLPSHESLSPFSAQLAGKMSPRPVNRSFAGAPFSGENSASARSTKSARATRCAASRRRPLVTNDLPPPQPGARVTTGRQYWQRPRPVARPGHWRSGDRDTEYPLDARTRRRRRYPPARAPSPRGDRTASDASPPPGSC